MSPWHDFQNRTCPFWCVAEHGRFAGEDDQVHMGAPVRLTPDAAAWLCGSADPDSGQVDGPYVRVNDVELTLDQARNIGETLIGLAETALEFERSQQALPRPRRGGSLPAA
jgi:Domain of unknown function (DUF6907)